MMKFSEGRGQRPIVNRNFGQVMSFHLLATLLITLLLFLLLDLVGWNNRGANRTICAGRIHALVG